MLVFTSTLFYCTGNRSVHLRFFSPFCRNKDVSHLSRWPPVKTRMLVEARGSCLGRPGPGVVWKGIWAAKPPPAASALNTACKPKTLLPLLCKRNHLLCSSVCVPLLWRNPCLEYPSSPWVFSLCGCPVSSHRLSLSCGREPRGAAESVGRAASLCSLQGCSQLSSHVSPPSCVARSCFLTDVSPTSRPATCARGFPIACVAEREEPGRPPISAHEGRGQRLEPCSGGYPLLRAEQGGHPGRAA